MKHHSHTDIRLQIDVELFKKIVGEDTIAPMGKYEKAASCKYPGKLMFLANDMPKFEQKDAFNILRRMWVLPMRAQFLSDDDELQKQTLAREGKASYIFKKGNVPFDDDIVYNHLAGYLKWVVEGAVAYYKEGIVKFVPEIIRTETRNEARDIVMEIGNFILTSIVTDADGFIPIDELKEVFLIVGAFNTCVDDTKRDLIYKAFH